MHRKTEAHKMDRKTEAQKMDRMTEPQKLDRKTEAQKMDRKTLRRHWCFTVGHSLPTSRPGGTKHFVGRGGGLGDETAQSKW